MRTFTKFFTVLSLVALLSGAVLADEKEAIETVRQNLHDQRSEDYVQELDSALEESVSVSQEFARFNRRTNNEEGDPAYFAELRELRGEEAPPSAGSWVSPKERSGLTGAEWIRQQINESLDR